MKPYLQAKKALLLDMNSTFIFGEDRFDSNQDYSIIYKQLGGILPNHKVNDYINQTYEYLAERYPNPEYFNSFPSIKTTLSTLFPQELSTRDIELLASTFAYHEKGTISTDYIEVLHKLSKHFRLGLVIDIWAEKDLWVEYFKSLALFDLFEAISFSSDHGHIKPSPYGFNLVLDTMQLKPEEVVFIGDSARRDLGGANNAGIECILVGKEQSELAIDHYDTLLEFYNLNFST